MKLRTAYCDGKRVSLASVALAAVVLTMPSASSAQSQDYFAGKQIRVIVPAGSGASGYGLYGQLAAGHLGRSIPGKPTVVISYMPGAAGLVAMNYLYEVAPRDGTVIAVMSQDLVTDQVRGRQGVKYDAARFNYIGRVTTNVPVHMVWRTARAKSIAELRIHEVVTGAVGSGGTHVDLPLAQNALLGTKWKLVMGYPSGNDVRIAMERGEVEAAIAPATLFNAMLKPLLDDGTVTVVVQYADFRHPALPDVPTVVEAAETPQAKDILRFLVSLATLGRSYAAPPGVSAEVVGTLRSAFHAMIADPLFIAEAEKLGADVVPLDGDGLLAHAKSVVATPAAVIARANEAVAQR